MMTRPSEQDVVQRLYFVGVSTAASGIMTIFPAWAEALGLRAEMHGVDLPVQARPDDVRAVIDTLAVDPQAVGALVTTHKAAVWDAASDRFSELDPWAQVCREISCIAVRDRGLIGWAKDPITSRQAYTHLLGEDPWGGGERDLVCLGAGGAGLALAAAVLDGGHQPRRVVLADRDPGRLTVSREVLDQLDVRAELELVVTSSPEQAGDLVSASAEGSLVVNATGMGKDLPGSPVGPDAVFPRGAVAWDMNYRGDLAFLDIARAQQLERGLVVADGWRYFLHGWTEVIAELFGVAMSPDVFAELASIAGQVSGREVGSAGVSRG
ncbi:shikimate dehydrogenase [Longivirga aurantiaca]|uniref:Shikimate dehydrogenase n=1 Tax=Longivirga aurantiaca TaxID=1837743 RepID=A0ABW1SYX8_9ACTN